MFVGSYFYLINGFVRNDNEQTWQPGVELYEVFRVIDGLPLFLDEHLMRLEGFFLEKELKMPCTVNALQTIIFSLIQKVGLKHGNVRVSFDLTTPELRMAVGEIHSSYPQQGNYLNGVAAAILNEERTSPNVKIYQQKLRTKAQELITKAGAYDVILCNKKGEITEGSRTNVFFVRGNELFTPPVEQVLPGITRQRVLELCRKNEIVVHIDRISENELPEMDAAFFTGTSPGILPISHIGVYKFNVKHSLLLKINKLYGIEVKLDLNKISQKMSKI